MEVLIYETRGEDGSTFELTPLARVRLSRKANRVFVPAEHPKVLVLGDARRRLLVETLTGLDDLRGIRVTIVDTATNFPREIWDMA
jgi:hypothetical protein